MTFRPYSYQQRVADLVLAGKNIILQAPTGAGKTRATLMPFLESLHPDSHAKGVLPSKCIYSVPMRVLAKQFHHEFDKSVKEYSLKIARDISVKIQTGDESRDKKLESNLIFATIDQTLSSFLISPYSLSKRQANLNAGAVISSYLVFDEFHLLDPDSTLPTTLQMLKMLKGVTPFLLMTATFSQTMLEELAEELDAVVVGISDTERAEFAGLQSQDKSRFYHSVENVMSAENILDKHEDRTLVICNTIARSRRIYEEISAIANPEIEVLLLHSHFLAQDRKETEDKIRAVFGQKHKTGNYIVVSTQAIEVGVDMSSKILHTELAPANSIIQRAGRCARYQKDVGHIYIYRDAFDKEGEVINLAENPLPYSNSEDVISKTWDAFDARNGIKFSYDDEQAVLSEAHHEQDRRIINELRGGSRNHRNLIYASLRGQEDARSLIRNIIAQPVTIHANPAEVAQNPFAYPAFSLHPGTLQAHLKQWLENPDYQHANQICMIRLNENEGEAQANDERYIYEPVSDASQAWMAPLLVIHPNLATYDSRVGFIPDYGGKWIAKAPEKSGDENRSYYGYRLETYEDHISQVYRQFERYWVEAKWSAKQLEQEFKWERGSIEKAARLALLLHDVGKLSKGWQDWVRDYQAKLAKAIGDKGFLTKDSEAYAHTDYKPAESVYFEMQKSMKPRPWHSVEGAYAVLDILFNELKNDFLVNATYTAIARHHTSQSSEHQTYQLEASAKKHIEASFEGRLSLPDLSALYGVDEEVSKFDSEAKNYIIDEQDRKQLLTYMLIVRVLRRADSKGTEQGSLEID